MAKKITLLLLKVCLLSLVVTTAAIAYVLSIRPLNHNTMRCDMSGISFGVGWFVVICLTIATTTAYLNLKISVREKGFYSFLSFYLLPFVISFSLAFSIGTIASKELCALLFPYFAILTFFYFKFRKGTLENK